MVEHTCHDTPCLDYRLESSATYRIHRKQPDDRDDHDSCPVESSALKILSMVYTLTCLQNSMHTLLVRPLTAAWDLSNHLSYRN